MENSNNPTLCLNMIVKNESNIILRLLESVEPFIDSFCICDTGSTDNTIEIIQHFFKNSKIKGKIVQEKFINFGHNRTFALNACFDVPKSDYLLLLDADMQFQYKFDISVSQFKAKLIHDAYLISQGNDSFNYQNVRIVKNRRGFSYWGVTHEYVKAPENSVSHYFHVDELFINDIGDGGCKDDKTERDIRLLENGLLEEPNNDRYTFYLANSYKDKGDYSQAISYYEKRIQIGGWIEEVWYSHYSIGKCYLNMGKPSLAIFHFLEAYNRHPKRIENLYEIIKYYRNLSYYNIAYKFYLIAKYERDTHTSRNYLFTEMDVYNYKIDYEFTIIGYYINYESIDLKYTSMHVLKQKSIDQSQFSNTLSNYKFYTSAITDLSSSILFDNLLLLNQIGKELINHSIMTSSTPSISLGRDEHELIVCVRFVNYSIDVNGNYINSDNIITINVIALIDTTHNIWKLKSQSILDYDKTYDDFYIGIEDIRILRQIKNDSPFFSYSSNRSLLGNMQVQHGIIDISTFSSNNSQFLTKNDLRTTEKNWVLFDDHGSSKCIYEWYPLTIGNINSNGVFDTIVQHNDVPFFFKSLRGSTNGTVIGNEIWFISHIVSYEDRRHYYHIMVSLDRHTYKLKSYTPLWTFEKQKVEYTLGMVYYNNNFLIGYSTMDNSTKYVSILKSVFDSMMIQN